MLKNGKIQFFSIWAGATSSRAMKVIDTWKNCIFSQFLEFLNFGRFWPLLTQFWISNAGAGFVIFYDFSNRYFTFHTQNWVKNSQNWPKFINFKNWEKMQFFHVSITLVAPKLDSLAQIADWVYFGFLNFHRPLLPLYREGGFKIHAQLRFLLVLHFGDA